MQLVCQLGGSAEKSSRKRLQWDKPVMTDLQPSATDGVREATPGVWYHLRAGASSHRCRREWRRVGLRCAGATRGSLRKSFVFPLGAACAWLSARGRGSTTKEEMPQWCEESIAARWSAWSLFANYTKTKSQQEDIFCTNPEFASSWQERRIAELLTLPEVHKVGGDQCQYGQQTSGGHH